MKPSLVACLMVCYLLGTALGKTVYIGPAGVGTDSIGCGNTTTNACSLLGVAFDPMKGGVVDGDTVELMAGVYDDSNSPGALDLGLYGQENVTLVGQGVGISIIDLNDEHHLELNGNNGWIIANMTIVNGLREDGGDGGCLGVVDSSVTVENLGFENCSSSLGDGGAVSWTGSNLHSIVMEDVEATSCNGLNSGCIHIESTEELYATVSRVVVRSGRATSGNNGCFHFKSATPLSSSVNISDLVVSDCEAASDTGGGSIETIADVRDVVVSSSTANGGNPGGLRVNGGTMNNVTVRDCHSQTLGGGILSISSSSTWDGLVVEECTSQSDAGGIYFLTGDTVHNARIRRNFAYGGGGGAYLGGGSNVAFYDSEISFNSARCGGYDGGGLMIRSTGGGNWGNNVTINNNLCLDVPGRDNIMCEDGANGCDSTENCGACRFGYCDFKTGATRGGCVCFPGVVNSATGSVCDSCGYGSGYDSGLRRCQPCGLGEYAVRGPQLIEVCELCPMGTYRGAREGNGLSACTPCPPNTYFNASTAGASSADVCVPCPSGLSSKEGSLSCDSGNASGDITNAVVAINGDLVDLENSLDSRIGDLESDIASVLAAISTFTPPDAIGGGVRIGMKVYCDAGYQHDSSGDGCEPIPPPELTPTTAIAVSISLAALAAVGIGFMLLRSSGSHGGRQLPPSPKTPNSSL